MTKIPKYTYAVGRCKEAIAQIRLYQGKQSLVINDKQAKEYFPSKTAQSLLLEPLRVTNTADKIYATIKVGGGGKNGQLSAVIHGLARALAKKNPDQYRPVLKKKGFLIRDARVKERRKYGHAQKARAKKQSPKR